MINLIQTEWIQVWGNKIGYQRSDFKNMAAFAWNNHEEAHKACFPEPLSKMLANKFPAFQPTDLHYDLNELVSFMLGHAKEERLYVDGFWKGYKLSMVLCIDHYENQRKVDFSTSYDSLTVPLHADKEQIQTFSNQLYAPMMMFIEQYSPYRLELVTHAYAYNIPK